MKRSIPISQVEPKDVIRFLPYTKKNKVTAIVGAITHNTNAGLYFVHGVRSTSEGVIDSQAKLKAWPVREGSTVELLA